MSRRHNDFRKQEEAKQRGAKKRSEQNPREDREFRNGIDIAATVTLSALQRRLRDAMNPRNPRNPIAARMGFDEALQAEQAAQAGEEERKEPEAAPLRATREAIGQYPEYIQHMYEVGQIHTVDEARELLDESQRAVLAYDPTWPLTNSVWEDAARA